MGLAEQCFILFQVFSFLFAVGGLGLEFCVFVVGLSLVGALEGLLLLLFVTLTTLNIDIVRCGLCCEHHLITLKP